MKNFFGFLSLAVILAVIPGAADRSTASMPMEQGSGQAVVQDLCVEDAAPGSKWVDIGPLGADIGTLDEFHGRSRELFAASSAGIIYRTVNLGATWIRRGAVGSGLLDMVVNPLDRRRLYALAAGYRSAEPYYFYRVLISSDGGATWRSSELPARCQAAELAIHPSAPGVLWASGCKGFEAPNPTEALALFRSNDEGASWTVIEPDPDDLAEFYPGSLSIAPSDPAVMYVSGFAHDIADPRVYRTLDGGASWTNVTGPFDNPRDLVVDARDPMKVLLAGYDKTGSSEYGQATFHSSDGGATWTVAEGRTDFGTLAADAVRADTFYGTLGPDLYRSTDGGATWVRRGPIPRWHIVSAVGGLFAFGPDGVFRSFDAGLTWKARNRGFRERPVFSFAVAPSAPRTMYAHDSSGVFRTANAGRSWTALIRDEAYETRLRVDPSSPRRLFLLEKGPPGLKESRDGGRTWVQRFASASGPRDFDVVWAPRFRIAVANDENDLPISDDGTSWRTLRIGTAESEFPQAVALAPSDPDRIFVGTYGAILVTTDLGSSWTKAALETSRNVRALAVHPADPDLALAGVGRAWDPAAPVALLRTTDGGASWTKVGDFDAVSIRFDPRRPSKVFAGGSGGLYVSIDAGATWTAMSAGLPSTDVRVVDLDRTGRIVYAATAGGIWKRKS